METYLERIKMLLLLLLDAVFGSVVTIQPGLVWKIQFRILGKFPCKSHAKQSRPLESLV